VQWQRALHSWQLCRGTWLLTRVYRPFLASYDEVVDIAMWESQTCHCYGFALLVLQLQRLLWLRQHVQAPRTQSPIRRHAYQVMGILGAHHT
jgi:hypothetical protein